jgi:hypothetical protein
VRTLTTVAIAAVALLTPFASTPAATGGPADPAPPYVDRVEWAKFGDLSSLRVYPTQAGREASVHATAATEAAAWAEVLTLSPDADMPGMYQQFICHWELAELGYPGKTSWNLEPWRPAVSDAQMFETRCNPGGTEEPF